MTPIFYTLRVNPWPVFLFRPCEILKDRLYFSAPPAAVYKEKKDA